MDTETLCAGGLAIAERYVLGAVRGVGEAIGRSDKLDVLGADWVLTL